MCCALQCRQKVHFHRKFLERKLILAPPEKCLFAFVDGWMAATEVPDCSWETRVSGMWIDDRDMRCQPLIQMSNVHFRDAETRAVICNAIHWKNSKFKCKCVFVRSYTFQPSMIHRDIEWGMNSGFLLNTIAKLTIRFLELDLSRVLIGDADLQRGNAVNPILLEMLRMTATEIDKECIAHVHSSTAIIKKPKVMSQFRAYPEQKSSLQISKNKYC